MALERKFCGFYRNIFKNCEKCSYEAVFAFFWQVAEMTNKLSIGKFEVKIPLQYNRVGPKYNI